MLLGHDDGVLSTLAVACETTSQDRSEAPVAALRITALGDLMRGQRIGLSIPRCIDGATAARVLARLEEVLLGAILDECSRLPARDVLRA